MRVTTWLKKQSIRIKANAKAVVGQRERAMVEVEGSVEPSDEETSGYYPFECTASGHRERGWGTVLGAEAFETAQTESGKRYRGPALESLPNSVHSQNVSHHTGPLSDYDTKAASSSIEDDTAVTSAKEAQDASLRHQWDTDKFHNDRHHRTSSL